MTLHIIHFGKDKGKKMNKKIDVYLQFLLGMVR